jgi:hypothetical protein
MADGSPNALADLGTTGIPEIDQGETLMASAPLVDVLASEAATIRQMHRTELAEFLTDVSREGWGYARREWPMERLGKARGWPERFWT